MDIRFPGNEGKTNYHDLTEEAKKFIANVEKELDVPVTMIGTGPASEHIIDRRS